MDSGNSGSLQSSSGGGDEEFDSRGAGDSVSAFMGGGGGNMSNPQPSFFDPLSNYLHLHQNTNPSLLDPSPAWPRIASLRSDQTSAAHDGVNMLPSSSHFMPASASAGVAGAAVPSPPNANQAAARNPKKRSRASRRAPTTVLTTDTTNFRAMVQEFTGIPAPPFDGGPSFPRARLDLFGPSRSTASFSPAPPAAYLRRPFAQKIHPPPLPFLASASALGATSSSTSSAITSSAAAGASGSSPAINNYQSSQNLFHNPFLANLLQANPKFPFPDHPPTQFSLGGGHGHSFMSSDQISPHNNSEKYKEDGRDHGLNLLSSSLNGSYEFPGGTEDSKMNTSFLDTGGGKRPESNNTAGEGMVESWICSSE